MSKAFLQQCKAPAWCFFILLFALFFFRLAYGLTSEFWFEDELQIYLIGLKFYTSGHWPYFGPDIVYTASQIPGALQGLLTGSPFFLLSIPESPVILVNLISFSSLCFLAWYIRRILPRIPWWFVWIWVLTCPWTLNYSTTVLNPSYAVSGGIFFFVAFLESIPELSSRLISRKVSMFLMGFSLFWVMQLHMSWVLFIPYLIYSLVISFRVNRSFVVDLCFLFLGAMVPLATLVPTFVQYGMAVGTGDSGENIRVNWQNVQQIITLISRYLSFASYELPRFLGSNTPSRLALVMNYWPLIPCFLFLLVIGLLQPVVLFTFLFIPSKVPAPMKWLTASTMLLIWVSFFFSVKGPSSHTFYVAFPLAMIYSMFVWNELFIHGWFRKLMAVMLFSGVLVSGALIHDHYYSRSMYKNREIVQKAIDAKNHHLLGERRSWDRNN